MSIILGLIPIVIIAWFLAGIGMQGWSGIYTYLGTPNRRPSDVSQQNIMPPPVTKESIATLESLGFQRLGEAQLQLPSRKPVPYWLFVNADHSILAEAIYERVSFSTMFKENIFVVTDYPRGEHITTATYLSHTVVSSIKDALDYHIQQVKKYGVKHGSPQSVLSMADYLHWDAIERVKYVPMKLHRFLWIDVARLAVFLYGAIVIMGFSFAWKANLGSLAEKLTFAEVELGSIGLTLPAIFVPQILTQWVIKASKRDSRSIPQKPA